jgi:hypothetical protein
MTLEMRRPSSEQILIFGQVLMAASLAVCVGLHPGLVLKKDEGGLSNYGIHLRTAIPYSIALLAAGASCLYVAAADIRLSRSDHVILLVYGLSMIAVLFSTYPYLINHAWHTLHVDCGVVLITWEFFTAWWLTLRSHFRQRWIWQLGQSAGSVLILLTLVSQLHVLFVAQVMTGTCWGVVMIGYVTTNRAEARRLVSGR